MNLLDIHSLAFEITSHCNIKCPQCSRIRPDGELADFIELRHWDVSKIMPNLELDRLTNLKHVRLEGDNGDALMHPDFEKIIDHVYHSQAKPNILILTNGSMRSAAWWRNFGSRFPGRLVVQFSIDGLADTSHLYRVGSNYHRVIENARAFISAGGIATQRCLIFKHNQHQLDEIRQVAKSTGFQQLIVIPGDIFRFQNRDHWQVWYKGQPAHVIRPATELNTQSYRRYEYNHLSNKRMFRSNADLDLLCPNLSTGEITITYKGHLIPCCMHHADLYFDHPSNDQYKKLVGNPDLIDLNQRSLGEILSDPDYYGRRLEQSLVNDRLSRCQSCCSHSVDQKLKTISFKK